MPPSSQFPGPGRPSRTQVYQRLDDAIAELDTRLGGLPTPAEAQSIWDDMWVHEAHNSTAIEGNTLVLRQVQELLHEGRAVGNKQLAEYLEVQGYADAARWVYREALESRRQPRQLLTLHEVRNVHELVMGKVWDVAPHPEATPDERPGNFRKHDIAPFPDGMQPPSHVLVPAGLQDWMEQVNALELQASEHLLERLARVHATFEQVHPFLDGNGRTGRLLLNLLLTRLGHPPAIVQNRDRERYLRALRRADAGHVGPLAELLARAVLDNLHRFVIPAVAGPARLVPLAALATPDLSAIALANAARRGRLQAQRGTDGYWRSSRAWVGEYAASRQRRP